MANSGEKLRDYRAIYRHDFNALDDCVKCGSTSRFRHMDIISDCPIPDDKDELRCADVEAELTHLGVSEPREDEE